MLRSPQLETLIEFSHRLTSGLALISVVILLVWALRRYPTAHLVRRGAWATLFLMLSEALIGAGLVLFEYVAFNQSLARAFWMAGHLTNTFFLLAAITLTAWWASGNEVWQWRGQGMRWLLAVGWGAMLVLGISGGITALGDTLVLTGGISPAESTMVAQLVALRIYHPLLAIGVGIVLVTIAWIVMTRRPSPQIQQWGRTLIALFGVELGLGVINVALKAPVWMQIIHLLVADLLWITLVLLTAAALATTDKLAVGRKPATVTEQLV